MGIGGKRALVASIVAVGLMSSVAGCSLDAATMCEAVGGTYAGRTCLRWTPSQQAAQEACETSGGVYLGGQDTCEFGMGGP